MANAVAKGSIQVGLDDAALRAGMAAAASAAKVKGDEIQNNLNNGTGKAKGKGKGDFGKLLDVGALGAMVGGFFKAAEAVVKLDGSEIRLNRAFEESQRLSEKFLENFSRRLDEGREKVDSLKDVLGTAMGADEINKQLKDLAKEMDGSQRNMASAKTAMEDLDSVWKDFGGSTPYDRFKNLSVYLAGWTGQGTSLEDQQKKAALNYETMRKKVEEGTKRQIELNKLKNRLENPDSNPEAQGALRSYANDIDMAIGKLKGMTDEQIKQQQLMKQFGFKENDFWLANSALRQKNWLEGKKLTDDLTDSIARQALGMEKTAEEAQLEELIKKGIDKDQIARIRQLIDLKKEEAIQYKGLQAIEAGSWDFYKSQNERAFNEAKMNRLKGDKGVADMIKKLEEIRKEIAAGKPLI